MYFLGVRSSARFHDLSFINRDTGYVAGMLWNIPIALNVVIHTSNGGDTWDTTNFPSNFSVRFVAFYNENIGVCGFPNIYITKNGGDEWERVINVAYETSLNYGKMLSENLIYVSGNYGKIIKSTDGGYTWEYIQPAFIKEYPTILSVLDSNNVYALAEEQLIFTSDGGNNWIEIDIPRPPGVTYNYLDFINVNYGWIVGSSRHIYRTTDGGQSWLNQSPPQAGDAFTCIDALDSMTAIAGTSRAAILRTDNGGSRWIEQLSGKYNAIIDRVQIIDKEVAYAVG
ncbi:MAG: YCF48-related protein, partial [bacterium]